MNPTSPTEIQNSLDDDKNLSYAFSSPLEQPAILVYCCPKGRKGGKNSIRNKLINLFLKPNVLLPPPANVVNSGRLWFAWGSRLNVKSVLIAFDLLFKCLLGWLMTAFWSQSQTWEREEFTAVFPLDWPVCWFVRFGKGRPSPQQTGQRPHLHWLFSLSASGSSVSLLSPKGIWFGHKSFLRLLSLKCLVPEASHWVGTEGPALRASPCLQDLQKELFLYVKSWIQTRASFHLACLKVLLKSNPGYWSGNWLGFSFVQAVITASPCTAPAGWAVTPLSLLNRQN